MRRKALISALSLALGAVVAATPALAREHRGGEQQLARILDGRVAGKPQDCIDLYTAHTSEIVDHTAIVYGSGPILWVNRPRDAHDLISDRVMLTKTSGSQLCQMDLVKLKDPATLTISGFVTLDEFVPYSRPRRHADHRDH